MSTSPPLLNAPASTPNYGSTPTASSPATPVASGTFSQVQVAYLANLLKSNQLTINQVNTILAGGPNSITSTLYPLLTAADLANLGAPGATPQSLSLVSSFVPPGSTVSTQSAPQYSFWLGQDNALYQALIAVPAGSPPPSDGQQIGGVVAWKKLGAPGSLSAMEAGLLAAANITGIAANLAVAFRTPATSDANRVKQHFLTLTATGACGGITGGAFNSLFTMTFPTPASRTVSPKLRCFQQNTAVAAAWKGISLQRLFNGNGYCTGYQGNAPLALANGDTIQIDVEVDEMFS